MTIELKFHCKVQYQQVFLKENVFRYLVWIYRDLISLIQGTR